MFYVIHATAGYGKTRTIRDLIDFYAFNKTKTESLYLTYTKSNVLEAREKLYNVLSSELIRTIHSLCYVASIQTRNLSIAELFIKQFNKQFRRCLTPIKQQQEEVLIDTQLKTRDDYLLSLYNKLRAVSKNPDKDVYMIADSLKIKGLNLDDFFNFVNAWEYFKQENDLVDFTDLLNLVETDDFKVLFSLPKLKNERPNPFLNVKYVFVDEAQDLSPSMWQVIDKLLQANNNRIREVYFVGDTEQTIYKFQGAEPVFLLTYPQHLAQKYEREFKITERFESFRCKSNILQYAMKFSDKKLIPKHQGGEVREFVSIEDFVKIVKENKDKSVFVITRHNKQVNEYIKLLNAYGIIAISLDDWNKILSYYKELEDIQRLKENAKWSLYSIYVLECKQKKEKQKAYNDVNFKELYERYKDIEVVKKIFANENELLKYIFANGYLYPVVISTAHSLKGLECDIAYVDLDYNKTSFNSTTLNSENLNAEKNVFFVATTRPREMLLVSGTTIKFAKLFNLY